MWYLFFCIDLCLFVAVLYSIVVCGNLSFVVFQTNVSSILCLYVLLHFLHLFVYILFVCVAFCIICDCVHCCIFLFVCSHFVCLCVCIVVFFAFVMRVKRLFFAVFLVKCFPLPQNVKTCVCVYVCPARLHFCICYVCGRLSCPLMCSSSNVSLSPQNVIECVCIYFCLSRLPSFAFLHLVCVWKPVLSFVTCVPRQMFRPPPRTW